MTLPGAARSRLTRMLEEAFAEGLISEDTFHVRMDAVLRPSLIRPAEVIGDLSFREGGLRARLTAAMTTVIGRLEDVFGEECGPAPMVLALDWTGCPDRELVIGRHVACDVVLTDLSVSRRHARLIPRDHRWILQDLASTNGTMLNGRRVGRCELRPGDRLVIGEERLRID